MALQQVKSADFEVMAGPGTELRVCGDLDVDTAPLLRAALSQVLARAAHPAAGGPIVLDLTDMGFIDAVGLGVLAGAARRAHSAGHDITLRNPRPGARRVLEVTGLWKVFVVEPEAHADTTLDAA